MAEYMGGTCFCAPKKVLSAARTSSSVTRFSDCAVTIPVVSCVSVEKPSVNPAS